MEIKLTQKQSHVRAEVTVPAEKMRANYNIIFQRIAPGVSIPGFRPGKAPKTMIVEAFGAQRLQNLVSEEAIKSGLREVLQKNKLNPLGMPSVSIIKQPQFIEGGDESLRFAVEFDVLPEVKFTSDYKKIKLSPAPRSLPGQRSSSEVGGGVGPAPQEPIEVKPEEINKAMQALARRMAQFKEVLRGAKKGDKIEISFQGYDRKVAIEQLASKNHPVILGDNSLIPGFEEKIIGAKKGEKKEFDITFPKDYYAKQFAGNKYHFEVTVEKVEEVLTPKLDDEFAKKLKAKSLEDLEGLVFRSISAEKLNKAKQVREDEVIGKLIKIARVDLPATLIESEKARLKKQIEDIASRQGVTFEKYIENVESSPEKFDEDISKQAGRNILVGLSLSQIAKNEKIEIKKEESLTKVVEWLIAQSVHKVT